MIVEFYIAYEGVVKYWNRSLKGYPLNIIPKRYCS